MKSFLILITLAALIFSCQQDEPTTPEDFGYLTIGISVKVESEPASGRVAAVNTDNFKVTIFQADGTEYLVIDPFSSAPPEVQLPVGEYYVEATSNDLVEAAFDSPYYFARSDNFTIDKEELKTIDIEAKLANCKVAINFSSEVTSVFDAYSGQVEVVSSGTTLSYAQGETREGYFVVEPLAVEVYLSYTKLDGTTIDRTFNTSIDDPQPATLYNINVDATLEDGQIVFNLTVDESVDTVDIDLGDVAVVGGCQFSQFVLLEDGDIETADISYAGSDIDQINFSTNYNPDTRVVNLTYDGQGRISLIESVGGNSFREEFLYNADSQLIERNRYRDYGSGYEFNSKDVYQYNPNGQLVSFEQYRGNQSNPTLDYREVYTYSDNVSWNPSKYEAFNSFGVNYKDVYLTYDDKPNPINESGLWICDDCFDFELPPFTTNNIATLTEYDGDVTVFNGVITSVIEYNVDDLISEVTYTDSSGDYFTHRFDYTCE